VIDLPEVYQEFRALVQSVAPHLTERITLYSETEPIFDHYQISADIESATKRVVPLQHGAYLIIEETEALTAIDVNTGRFVGKSRLADTILQTNLEAVEEAARQLRLRDIGGIIVIDLIDMERTRDRIKVMNALEAALKHDRTRTRIVQLSPTGLVEITRRREGQSLRQLLHQLCPYCSGDGVVKSADTIAIETRRSVRAAAQKSSMGAVQVMLHPETAVAFLGTDAEYVQPLEASTGTQLFLRVDLGLHVEASRIKVGQAEDFTAVAGDLQVGQHLHLPVDSPLYPESNSQFTIWDNRLILLQSTNGTEYGDSGLRYPVVAEVIDIGRWFVTTRVLVHGEPPTAGSKKPQ
ncbi:MAG: ribonuclease E/G, partial [Armatimonadota bacterium]|nr:ribonuclease E/G [Armatimonadota bacterium]